MHIAIIGHKELPGGDIVRIRAQLLIKGRHEISNDPKAAVEVLDEVDLSSPQETLIRRLISSGDATHREEFEALLSQVASSAYQRGSVHGHTEAVREQ